MMSDESSALALQIIAWALSDQRRAERILALTGLDPHELRMSLTQNETLAALLDFVINHEPDLLACAADLSIDPRTILATRALIAP